MYERMHSVSVATSNVTGKPTESMPVDLARRWGHVEQIGGRDETHGFLRLVVGIVDGDEVNSRSQHGLSPHEIPPGRKSTLK